jgi:hypothetical protein
MREAPQALRDYLATHSTCWTAELYTITPRSPALTPYPRLPLRFTSHEQTIALSSSASEVWAPSGAAVIYSGPPHSPHGDDGEEVYYAAGDYVTSDDYAPAIRRGQIRQSAGLSIDTLDLTIEGSRTHYDETRLLSQTFARHSLEGFFDDADVRIDRIFGAYPGDLSLGLIDKYWTGIVGEVSPGGLGVTLACRGGLIRAQSCVIPSIRLQASCNLALYSTPCGVARVSHAVDCEIASATTTSVTIATPALSATADYYALGTILWGVGSAYPGAPGYYPPCPAVGRIAAIKATGGSSGQVITFARPLLASEVPSAGMHCTLLPGCDKTRATCETRYDNLARYRGYPHVPQTGTGGK